MHESVLRGPPHIAIRMLVAPVLVASTAVVFGMPPSSLTLGPLPTGPEATGRGILACRRPERHPT